MGYDGFEPYVSVAERRQKAKRAAEKLKKKNPSISPVTISGTKLATTWWGKAWNQNLESYSDYENRIDRGRSYVRHGAVLHLEIKPGFVAALVQGSSRKPYDVQISISSLNKAKWEAILTACEGELDSLQELLDGKFPKSLQALFLSHDKGLFPSPKEIRLSCSCPDYAAMCKHVAAVLYGVGTRLDEDPSLFFVLREASIDALIEKALQKKTDQLMKTPSKSRRVRSSDDLSALFGIDVSDATIAAEPTVQEDVKLKTGRPIKQAPVTVEPVEAKPKRGRPRKIQP